MNLGIYIETLSNHEQLEDAVNILNTSLENKSIKDGSIFYDGIGFNPFKTNCGMFNSTDLWNFNGTLITTSLGCLVTAKNIANNIKLYYYHGLEQKQPKVLDLLLALNNCDANIICNNEENSKYIHRTTGKQALGISHKFNSILEIIGKQNG
jgi:hypothetical protein